MLYTVTLQGQYFGQQTINRWTYLMTGTPASVSGSLALTDAFGLIGETLPPVFPETTIFGKMLSIQNGNQTYIGGIVEAMYDPVDFYERPFPGGQGGIASGTPQSPAMAYGFRTNRVRTDVARGTKRFAGTSEESVDNGGVIVSSWQTRLNDLAALMTAPLEYDDEGTTITFTPVVAGKEEYTPSSGKRAYRKYATLAEQLEHTAVGVTWSALSTIRTQVSRQYGRGA